MENGFLFLDEAVRGIRWDAKYATWDNFTGKPVDGYEVNRVAGSYELARALEQASKEADSLGYGLLLWDGYRPKRAVECFLEWADHKEDMTTKADFYPNILRSQMVEKGYVADKSSHSRGSAIDLSLYDKKTGAMVQMGGHFDFMDLTSHHGAPGLNESEMKNRNLLRSIMENNGFLSYTCEWWHYILKNEPYPDTYFDFPVA